MKYEFYDKFQRWSSPASDAEEQKIDRVIREVKAAVDNSSTLSFRDVRVFPQGSYRNSTNVRLNSDVDVAIVCHDSYMCDYPLGVSREDVGLTDADYTYAEFKNDVGRALSSRFGYGAVTRGNKAFDIKATMSQVEADVAPFFEHRKYTSVNSYLEGVALRPDNGVPIRIVNWPQQHYDNGVAKNNATSRRYKSVVRIIKRLKNEMQENGIPTSLPITGFLIECLVWNVPNNYFNQNTVNDDVVSVLSFLALNTAYEQICNQWTEVSGLKKLFDVHQKWTRQEAHNFAVTAKAYIGV